MTRVLFLAAVLLVTPIRGWAAESGRGAVQPTAELARGQRGVALTAVEGARIEEIPITYLGLQRDAIGPGHDLHLIQLTGPIAERVGVASGMSGSPVYFDGELIGALSYRLGAFPTEPVAGVTPIEDMLEAAATPLAARGSALGSPITTPIQVGGLVGPVAAWIRPQLEQLGFVVVAGGQGQGGPSGDDLRPGSPIGVDLVRGDLSIAATGTVTFVDGDRVFAFGHRLLGAGPIEMPMVAAEVVHTLADLAGSVKLTRVGAEVGAIVEDRVTAIVGRRGHAARTIDLALRVRGERYGDRRFRFEVARNADLSPVLAAASVANALFGSTGYTREATLLAAGRIRIAGRPEVAFDLASASVGSEDPILGMAVSLQQILATLWRNPFAPVDLSAIELDVEVEPEIHAYRVDALHFDRGPVRPGQTLRLGVTLDRYRGEPSLRELELEIPQGLPEGAPLSVVVGSPEYLDRAQGQPYARRLRSAQDLDAVLRALGERPTRRRLAAALLVGIPGVVSRGVPYAELPPTAERLLVASPRSDGTVRLASSEHSRAEIELDGPVDGGLSVPLRLDAGFEPAAKDPPGS